MDYFQCPGKFLPLLRPTVREDRECCVSVLPGGWKVSSGCRAVPAAAAERLLTCCQVLGSSVKHPGLLSFASGSSPPHRWLRAVCKSQAVLNSTWSAEDQVLGSCKAGSSFMEGESREGRLLREAKGLFSHIASTRRPKKAVLTAAAGLGTGGEGGLCFGAGSLPPAAETCSLSYQNLSLHSSTTRWGGHTFMQSSQKINCGTCSALSVSVSRAANVFCLETGTFSSSDCYQRAPPYIHQLPS